VMAQAMADILKSQDVEIDSDVVQVVDKQNSKPESLHGTLPKFAKRFKSSSSKNLACRDDFDEQEFGANGRPLSVDVDNTEYSKMDSYGPGSNGTADMSRVFSGAAASEGNSHPVDSELDSVQAKANRVFSRGVNSTPTTNTPSDYLTSPNGNGKTRDSLNHGMSRRGLNMQTTDIYNDEDSAATAAFDKINKSSASPAKASAKKAKRRASKLFTGKSSSSDKKSGSSKCKLCVVVCTHLFHILSYSVFVVLCSNSPMLCYALI
jgi:hypothetical protein